MFDMQAWLQKVMDRVAQTRIGIAGRSADYNFRLSISDCIILAFRDVFAYFVTIQAVFAGKIEVWELVFYLGIITCIASFFTDLTNHMAAYGQRKPGDDRISGIHGQRLYG